MQTQQNGSCPNGRPRRPRDPRDKVGHKIGRCMLSQALEIAHAHRWVAEWLFPAEGDAAHPPLAPEAFERGLGIHMRHTLSTANYEGVNDPCGSNDTPKVIMNKEMNMLIVPVATADNVTVGYTFCSGHQYTKLTGFTPVTTSQGRHYIMSRYAFDMRARQFLNVSPNVSSNVSGIFQMLFHCDGSCERNFIMVPKLHYTADSMPSVVISSQCNLETRDLSSNPPTFQFDEEDFNPPTPVPSSQADPAPDLDESMEDLFRELNAYPPQNNAPLPFGPADPLLDPFMHEVASPDSSNSLVPHSPPPPRRWSFAADGSTDDGIGVPRKPGNAPTSAGLFDMSAMMSSLANLERSMKGNFFALRAKKDIMDPDTGDLLSRQTGHQVSLVESLGSADAARLRQIAAQHYYATFLSPAIDATLISPTIQTAAERVLLPPPPATIDPLNSDFLDQMVPEMSFMSRQDSPPVSVSAATSMKTSVKGPHTLAPRPAGRSENKRPETPVLVSALSPVDKAEAKKIRNRLSAAKSNQRRRAQIEAQKKELVVLHQRVEELKKKKQQIMTENEVLRAQFFGAPVEEIA